MITAYVTVDQGVVDAIRGAFASGCLEGAFEARLVDDVLQVGARHDVYGVSNSARWYASEIPHADATEGAIVLCAPEGELAQVFRAHAGDWRPLPFSVVRMLADYGRRVEGLLELDALRQRRVAVVGLGTGGGAVAVELARAGVGSLRLIDFDRLEAHNIIRHVCGLRDIGRYKTRAVADLLRDTSPWVDVETLEVDVLETSETIERVLEGVDLVVAATDSEAAKQRINEACWMRGIPSTYGAVYNRGFGGDAVLVVPPETACYACFWEQCGPLFREQEGGRPKGALPYEDPARLAEATASLGLSLDVAMVANLQARLALQSLTRGTSAPFDAIPSTAVFWGNRAEWIFERPLEALFVDVERQPECTVCNRGGFLARRGMTEEDLSREAERILAGAMKG